MTENEVSPTTGVYSGNDIAWKNVDDGIDLQWEELEASDVNEDEMDEMDLDCTSGDTVLHGDWIKDEEGSYFPDLTGEYAMIYNVNENTAQVVYSKTVKYSRLASPCYPGQVDARVDDPSTPGIEELYDDEGWTCGLVHLDIAYYALPEWAMYTPTDEPADEHDDEMWNM